MDAFVSIIIPCRNEEKYITQCLDSLLRQTYPKEKMEILVVDGASEDATAAIAQKFAHEHPHIKVIENPKRIIPAAMNVGIAAAKGEIILKADAHASYEKEYVSRCVHYLQKYNADNVGGILTTLPGKDTTEAKAIAISLSHFFGVGTSPFRRASGTKEPQEVDTVAFGCYKKEVFEKIGLYNEQLVRSSDMELNIRLRQAGGKILLVQDIKAFYYADPTFLSFWKHNFRDGIWAVYPLKFTRTLFRFRHFIPLVFVSFLLSTFLLSFLSSLFLSIFLISLLIYMLESLIVSSLLSLKEKKLAFVYLLPIAFACRHIGYGFGSIAGIVKLFK